MRAKCKITLTQLLYKNEYLYYSFYRRIKNGGTSEEDEIFIDVLSKIDEVKPLFEYILMKHIGEWNI